VADNLHKGADPKLFYYARLNRKVQTEAEKILWHCLRNRKLQGFKFRRQHPIAHFIADFFCLESNLVIEIDGSYHDEREQQEYDEGRTFELEEINVKVLRFTNEEVIRDTEFVLKEILNHLKSPHP